jgi:hypothetical protein
MEMIGCPISAYHEEYATLLHSWFSQKSVNTKSINHLLQLITMLPSFFAQMPSTAELCLVDGLPIIECLRSLTETLRSVDAHQGPTARPWQLAEISASKLLVALTNSYAEPSLSDDKSTVDSSHDSSSQDPTDDPIAPYWQRMEALASKVPMTLANAHAKSLMGDDELSAKGFVSSWCSIAITSELYLNAVLGLWNAGRPIDRRLLRVMFHILMRDLGEAKVWTKNQSSSNLRFWNYFIGAYSLAWHQSHEHDHALHEAQNFFNNSLKSWSDAYNIRHWDQAQRQLQKIIWPEYQDQKVAKKVWAKAIGKLPRASKPKVRTGCITCKVRHIKCDENKPICDRCATAKVQCRGYSDTTAYKTKPQTAKGSTNLVPLRPRLEAPK